MHVLGCVHMWLDNSAHDERLGPNTFDLLIKYYKNASKTESERWCGIYRR